MKENHICIARKSYFSCGVSRGHLEGGYNYTFEVFLYGPIDPVTGLVINLTDVNIALKAVGLALDQKHINYDLPGLNSFDLFNFHKYVNSLFAKEFEKLVQDNKIVILKTTLTEGLEGTSSLLTQAGQTVFGQGHISL